MSDQGQSKIAVVIGHLELKTVAFYVSVFCEFAYTMIFLLLIFGVFAFSESGYPDVVHLAIAGGLILTAVYFQGARLCDCHMNPAVTFAFMCCGQTPIVRSICYISVQVGAGILAALPFYLQDMHTSTDCCALSNDIYLVVGFMLELITTMLVVYVAKYISAPELRKEQAIQNAALYGLTFSAAYLVTFKPTNAGINPARCIGSAVWYGCWDYHWLYWIAPLSGGVLGCFMTLAIERDQSGIE